ncbi:MAG: flagellar basal body P-ring formation chaperone FlgA, partial [Burkholderiaceae bacterium]
MLWRLQIGPRARAAGVACAVWTCAAVAAAAAAPTPPAQRVPDLPWAGQVHQFAQDAARHQSPGRRVEVLVGALDSRLRLAPCRRTQPYLAGSARLWGRSRVGLRCVEGTVTWNVFVPVTVKVFGSALVAAAALPAGHVIATTDLAQAEVDLADNPSNPLTEPARAAGRSLVRPVSAGQVLRESHLRPRIWFAAGDEVRLVARGSGFQV